MQSYSSLSLKDISYLLALADHLHFGNAAEAVLVSQPALSKQIKEIEKILGTQIFERNKKQVSLTSKGELIIAQARRIAAEAEKLIIQASQKEEPLVGDLRLGIIASSGPYLIPKILKPLKKKYPKLNLYIHEGYTDDLLEQLKKSSLDLVIAADTFDEANLAKTELFFEPFLLAVENKNKLSAKKVVTEQDINPASMILLEEGNCLSDQTWALCPTKNHVTDSFYQATSLETLYHMVTADMGYSLVPAFSKSKDSIVNSLITYIPFKKKSIGRSMVLVHRSSYHSHETIQKFSDLIKKRY